MTRFQDDYFNKKIDTVNRVRGTAEEAAAAKDMCVDGNVAFMNDFVNKCLGDTKFIWGDEVTTADIAIGSFIVLVLKTIPN